MLRDVTGNEYDPLHLHFQVTWEPGRGWYFRGYYDKIAKATQGGVNLGAGFEKSCQCGNGGRSEKQLVILFSAAEQRVLNTSSGISLSFYIQLTFLSVE